MARLWQQIIRGEKGQALPIVLCFLLVGGLLIAPSLSYAATSLNAGEIVEENASGLYAADAAMEEALWCIMNSISPPEQLSESVNEMQVAILTEAEGGYALYHDELASTGVHEDWLDVSGEMVWDGEAEAYKYTITVIWTDTTGGSAIKLDELGVRLPIGYSYQAGSAASFADNLGTNEPNDALDGAGAHMIYWDFTSPHPEVSEEEPVGTQTFYITGQGDQEGDYTWVVARRHDVWVVSEVNGESYRITATATRPGDGEITAKVVAYVFKEEVEGETVTHIVSWKISPQ